MLARFFVVVVALASTALTAQEEASRLRLAVPDDWIRGEDGRTFVPPGGQAALTFAPSTPFAGNARAWMNRCWKDVEREFKLVSGPVPGTQGRFLTRIGEFKQADGTPIWLCLNTVVQDRRGEAVMFFAADAATFRMHLATVSALLQETPAPAPETTPGGPAPNQPSRQAMPPPPDLDHYVFTPPQGWQVQREAEQVFLTERPDRSGCLIQMLSPQPSSGDLQKDASAVFDMMYAGWQPKRYAQEKYVLSTGYLPHGLEFCMLEAPMERTLPDDRYDTEDGAALVVRVGDHVAILAVRHRSTFGHVEGCLRQYTAWNRFFNSFTVENAPLPERQEPPPAERIIGRWNMREIGAASAEYVFAANGNYAFSGALGSSYTSSDINYDYLHLTTYAFAGDGSYRISGNELTLTKRQTGEVERTRIRFEKINRGGAGWTDRLWILQELASGLNEVRYERPNP